MALRATCSGAQIQDIKQTAWLLSALCLALLMENNTNGQHALFYVALVGGGLSGKCRLLDHSGSRGWAAGQGSDSNSGRPPRVASRFPMLLSGHAMMAVFLKERWGWTDPDRCWWRRRGMQNREHLFKGCITRRKEIRILWREVGGASGSKAREGQPSQLQGQARKSRKGFGAEPGNTRREIHRSNAKILEGCKSRRSQARRTRQRVECK